MPAAQHVIAVDIGADRVVQIQMHIRELDQTNSFSFFVLTVFLLHHAFVQFVNKVIILEVVRFV